MINLIPLIGVWFKGWDPRQMFLVYCLETVIIGGFNIIKMVIVTFDKKKDRWEYEGGARIVSGWFFILFFIFHYGLFVFVQTSIFAGVSGLNSAGSFGPLTFLPNILKVLNTDAKTVLLYFVIMYGLRMLFDFILNKKYQETSLGLLMFQPYLRIFIQQFVVILGSMFLQFGAGKIFMLIFVVVKIYFEIFVNFDKYLEKAAEMQKQKDRTAQEKIDKTLNQY
ncbi:MAG: hypothetical protein H0W12_07940 [Chitinophagaceae bacterium]|nr:hypothetical protein [Chitinophagaceae bacterium]